MEINLPLEEAPKWLRGLVLDNHEGGLRIEIVKVNGSSYGCTTLSRAKILSILDTLEIV